jgi:hypothetical protein
VIHRVPLRQEVDLFYGKTRDVSTKGLYFTTYETTELGTKFELSFMLPCEITNGSTVVVLAQATAVRIEATPETIFERVGVGAIIDKFQILQCDPKVRK